MAGLGEITQSLSAEPRFQRLLANAQLGQWCENRDIDWSLAPNPNREVPRALTLRVVSQLYHGEMATEAICRQLIDGIGGEQARQCLVLQIGDEARHVAVYRRYLERLGDLAPADPAFQSALAKGVSWPGSAIGTLLAYHIVLEGEALNIQQQLTERVDCPLLNAINRRASPDEARHVAFGKLYLSSQIDQVDAAEREAIFLWLKDIWADCARATLTGLGLYRFVLKHKAESRLAAAWRRHLYSFARLGLIGEQALARELQVTTA